MIIFGSLEHYIVAKHTDFLHFGTNRKILKLLLFRHMEF